MATTSMNRGTSIIELEVCPSKSTGVLFQKYPTENMTLPHSTIILSAKRKKQ